MTDRRPMVVNGCQEQFLIGQEREVQWPRELVEARINLVMVETRRSIDSSELEEPELCGGARGESIDRSPGILRACESAPYPSFAVV